MYNLYKYKYLKYKHKYLELKQKGGEVLSTISKKNFETIFLIDFTYASKLDFISVKYNINDTLAIQLLKNYNDYMDELEESTIQTENQTQIQTPKLEESFEAELEGPNEAKFEETEQNQYYKYPEDEEDDPSDILKKIDIETWTPINSSENQYFVVKLVNDDTNYLLKLVNSHFKYEFKKNMEDYDTEYGKLMKMKNIIAPLYLFKDDENIISGYIVELNDDYITLNDFLDSENVDINNFIDIICAICYCFINIIRCGLKPCFKNNELMILPNEPKKVLFTGADELLKCKDDIEEETTREITKFLDYNKIPRKIKESREFNKIFDLTNTGITLKNNIVTVKGLLELVKNINF